MKDKFGRCPCITFFNYSPLRIKEKHRRKGICARLRAIDPQPQGTITKYELTILETPLVALQLIATRKYA